MLVTFLEALTPLTKTFTRNGNGAIAKTPYPFVWEFTSIDEQVKNLPEFEAALKKHAALNRCLLKGNVTRPLVKESRAGSTNSTAATEFIVLDLDGLPDIITVPQLLQALGIEDVSYIIQWSASYGIENKKVRAHVFMMLDKPVAAPRIKQWLIQKNHEATMLRDAMELTKLGNTVSWPLDISACQNDKLIYIAPPTLKGKIKDPMAGQPRISLVKRRLDRLVLPAIINADATNKALTHKRVDELREATGLPKRKTTYKTVGTLEVMVKPGEGTITEMKAERGFVYFNLNGGDSWAYYHPENNPDYILNFKGEPAYMTKELLPEYWAELCNKGSTPNSHGTTLLAFLDRATSTYHRGSYDEAADLLELTPAKSETQIRHFAKQRGLPLGDFIPEWDLVFDPHDSVRCDFKNRTVNTFQLTPYMKAVAKPRSSCPPTILKVIHHALGSNLELTEHFINWVAFILQKRDRACTAWVLQGVPGTGKGLMCTNILRPIFGMAQTTARRMEELNEHYNGWMKQSFLVFVDEVQTKALQNERGVMAKLKNFITEEFITIREMYSNAYEARNYTNWIFNSNMPDPVLVERGDRRFNIGAYQANKLVITPKEVAALEQELQSFHDYLLFYKIDEIKARTVLDTEDRNTLMAISESSVDTVANALNEGNFGFFIEHLPTDELYLNNPVEVTRVGEYESVLRSLLDRTDRNKGTCAIGREELRVLFQYTVGSMPTTPNKFTSLLKHHRIHTQVVWVPPKSVKGVYTTWKDLKDFPAHVAALTPTPLTSKGKVVSIKKTKATP